MTFLPGGLGLGALVTALGFGFRHGIDWDHLAALADLTASESSPRRALRLASAYVVGHALVVLALGSAAVLVGAELPAGVDAVMERFVGGTLVALGVYVVWSLARDGRRFRMRSRWTLLFAGARRLRARRSGSSVPVVIEHEHEHDHIDHVHVHEHVHVLAHANASSAAGAPARHAHRHVHVGALPPDPLAGYGTRAAFAIGLLHGIGAETPTQVLLFVAAAGAGGRGAGVALLVAFVVGLVCSNTVIAVVSVAGASSAANRWWLTVVVSGVTAAGSLVIGTLFLSGHATALPALFTG